MTPLWILALLLVNPIVNNDAAAHVASFPPPGPSTSHISNVSALVFTSPSSNSTQDEKFSCFHQGPTSRSISWAACTPIFTWLLRCPDAFERHVYKGPGLQTIYLSLPPCQIILGSRTSGTEIKISKQEIVSYARNLLNACRSRNAGGIWHVSEKWYVAIRGGAPSAARIRGLWPSRCQVRSGLNGIDHAGALDRKHYTM